MNEADKKLELVDESKLNDRQKKLLKQLKETKGESLDGRLGDILIKNLMASRERKARQAKTNPNLRASHADHRAPTASRLAADDLF